MGVLCVQGDTGNKTDAVVEQSKANGKLEFSSLKEALGIGTEAKPAVKFCLKARQATQGVKGDMATQVVNGDMATQVVNGDMAVWFQYRDRPPQALRVWQYATDKGPQPVTGDYDLWMVAPHTDSPLIENKDFPYLVQPKMVQIYGGRTTTTQFVKDTFLDMNAYLGRQNLAVFHHGPESNNHYFLQDLEAVTFIVPKRKSNEKPYQHAFTGSISSAKVDDKDESPLALTLKELSEDGFILLMNPLYNEKVRASNQAFTTVGEDQDIDVLQTVLRNSREAWLPKGSANALVQYIYEHIRYISLRKKHFIYRANQCNCLAANKEAYCDNKGVGTKDECLTDGKQTKDDSQDSADACSKRNKRGAKCSWVEAGDGTGTNTHAGDNWLKEVISVQEIRGNRLKYNCWDHDGGKYGDAGKRKQHGAPEDCETLFPEGFSAVEVLKCLRKHTRELKGTTRSKGSSTDMGYNRFKHMEWGEALIKKFNKGTLSDVTPEETIGSESRKKEFRAGV